MNIYLFIKIFIIFLLISIIFIIIGCAKNFRQIDSKEFQEKFEDSINNSAVSWWYLGENDDFYFIIEKWIFEVKTYKIDKNQLNIFIEKPKKITFVVWQWVNLKHHHVSFKKQTSSILVLPETLWVAKIWSFGNCCG